MEPENAKALADIAQYGCHIIHVLEQSDLPELTYSVGIQQSCGAPELTVIGLRKPIACFMINEYNRQVRKGIRYRPGSLYGGFVEGFDCKIQRVHKTHFQDYFGSAIWLYRGLDFKIYQLVYPTVHGVWPWDSEASEWFRDHQPLLEIPKEITAPKGRKRIDNTD